MTIFTFAQRKYTVSNIWFRFERSVYHLKNIFEQTKREKGYWSLSNRKGLNKTVMANKLCLEKNSQMGWSIKKQKRCGNLITFLGWLHIFYKFIIVKDVNLYNDLIFQKQSFIFDSYFTIAWVRRWFVMMIYLLSWGILFLTYLYELLIIEIIMKADTEEIYHRN